LLPARTSGACTTSDTGEKPATGSKGIFPACSVAFAARAGRTITMVWPSGGLDAAAAAPTMLFAPGLFSTTTGCPSAFNSGSATSRVAMSVVPPGV
jgi:hypothetical protein